MSNSAGLPSADTSAGSGVFSLFSRANVDRYGEIDEDVAHSPPSTFDFPDPVRFQPRKSKFHSLQEETGSSVDREGPKIVRIQGSGLTSLVIASQKPETQKISAEMLKDRISSLSTPHRVSVDSPHGSIEVSAAAATEVGLFEKAHLMQGVSQPVSPGPFDKQKFKVDVKPETNEALGSLVRRASDSNLLSLVTSWSAKPKAETESAVVSSSNVVEKASGAARLATTLEDTTDSARMEPPECEKLTTFPESKISSFTGWLFGGTTQHDVKNRDLNVIAPTSF